MPPMRVTRSSIASVICPWASSRADGCADSVSRTTSQSRETSIAGASSGASGSRTATGFAAIVTPIGISRMARVNAFQSRKPCSVATR